MAEDHKKIRNERPVHIGNKLQAIINHRRNAFVLERAFERRFPRDDLSRDQKCRFQPKSKQNKELFEIFQRIGKSNVICLINLDILYFTNHFRRYL